MKRLLTPGWLACHLLMVVLVVGMLGMAGWQLSRAAGGNALSWGYAAQWPVFAGFVGFVWTREVRRVLRGAAGTAAVGSQPSPQPPTERQRSAERQRSSDRPARRPVITRRVAPVGGGYEVADDPELAAYNRYLAWLNANPGARPVDYPG